MGRLRHAHYRLFALGAILGLTGCGGGIDLRVHKGAVAEGEKTVISARLSAPAATPVDFRITAGEECGTLSSASTETSAAGVATVTYTGAAGVEDCPVTIEASAAVPKDSANRLLGSTSFYVNKPPLTKARIDGVSLLVLFFIASFAIDRTVRALMFLLSFVPFWRRWVPDEGAGDSAAEKRRRLAYMLVTCILAILVLGWFGKVRMLAALGFAQVHWLVDILFTGLLLVGGAERTESLLRAVGAGSGGESGKDAATPIEITGRVVLEDAHSQDKAASAAQSARA
jgi:hypothetical protein